MPEAESLDTIRAAVDTLVPATDDLPGALAMGVDRHVVDMIELSFPGFTDLVAALLNAYAMDVRAGASFAELDPDERSKVLRAMSSDESQDVRDAVDALIVFTNGGVFSEWSGYERVTGTLEPPPSWAHAGFHGPSDGHPDYRKDT